MRRAHHKEGHAERRQIWILTKLRPQKHTCLY